MSAIKPIGILAFLLISLILFSGCVSIGERTKASVCQKLENATGSRSGTICAENLRAALGEEISNAKPETQGLVQQALQDHAIIKYSCTHDWLKGTTIEGETIGRCAEKGLVCYQKGNNAYCDVFEECGNNAVEGKEECDGTDFADKTCSSILGRQYIGELKCKSDCKLDTSGCSEVNCNNNGKVDILGEQCDGYDLKGKACSDIWKPNSLGTLGCNDNCTFNTEQCTTCGNKICDNGTEQTLDYGETAENCPADCAKAVECISVFGEKGITGKAALPKVKLYWDWGDTEEQLPVDACERIYCDPVQFTITLMKRLKAIDEDRTLGKNSYEIKFYSYFIGDNYSKQFTHDFVAKQEFFSAPSWFTDPATPFDKYLSEDKIIFEGIEYPDTVIKTVSTRIKSGWYKVKILIGESIDGSDSKGLFSNGKPNREIKVQFLRETYAENGHAFYAMPLNGPLGMTDESQRYVGEISPPEESQPIMLNEKKNYGVQISRLGEPKSIMITDSLIMESFAGPIKFSTTYDQDYASKRGLLLDAYSDGIVWAPRTPVPVLAVLKQQESSILGAYKLFQNNAEFGQSLNTLNSWFEMLSSADCDNEGMFNLFRVEDSSTPGCDNGTGNSFALPAKTRWCEGMYYEGNSITGLPGSGKYNGQKLTATIDSITAAGPEASFYTARFSLYDGKGNLIDSKNALAGDSLASVFTGSKVTFSGSYMISDIGVETRTNKEYAWIDVYCPEGTVCGGSECIPIPQTGNLYATTFYLPQDNDFSLKPCANGSVFATSNITASDTGSVIPLENAPMAQMLTLQRAFDLVAEEKVCVIEEYNKIKFFWNEKKLLEELQPVFAQFTLEKLDPCYFWKIGTCVEDDDGKDYYKKGSTMGYYEASKNFGSVIDTCQVPAYGGVQYCSSGVQNPRCEVMEYYCTKDNSVAYELFECPVGCQDGACVSDFGCQSDKDCSETECSEGAAPKCDLTTTKCYCHNLCSGPVEYVCGTDGKTYKNTCSALLAHADVACLGPCPCPFIGCSADLDCTDLECPGEYIPKCDVNSDKCYCKEPEETVCTDSDGGIEFDVKGEVCIEGNCSIDYCENQSKIFDLVEYYCAGPREIGSETPLCSNGCKDGACISDPVETPCSKSNYFEGTDVKGIKGAGAYEGEKLSMAIVAISQAGPSAAGYSVRLELYNSEGNLLDIQTVKKGDWLHKAFSYKGMPVLADLLYVSQIAVEAPTQRGYVTLDTVCSPGFECVNGECVPENRVEEWVHCIFNDSQAEQECFDGRPCESDYCERSGCTAIDGCSFMIEGYKGEKATIASSCRYYKEIIIDGQDEELIFDCPFGGCEGIYYEGDTAKNLKGREMFTGEKLKIKVGAITVSEPSLPVYLAAPAMLIAPWLAPVIAGNVIPTYSARFELYDWSENLIDSVTVGTGVYLNEEFSAKDGKPLLTRVYVYGIGGAQDRGFVDLEISCPGDTECQDGRCVKTELVCSKSNYYAGDYAKDFAGMGKFEGQKMSVLVAAIIAESPGSAYYSARFELYDAQGNLIDTRTAKPGTYLDKVFSYQGVSVLANGLKVSMIGIESPTGKGFVTLDTVCSPGFDCVNGQCVKPAGLCSKTNYFEGDKAIGLRGSGKYEKYGLIVKIASVTSSGSGSDEYVAKIELYDLFDYLLDTQTVKAGTYLDRVLIANGEYVLVDRLLVSQVAVEAPTGRGYVTLDLTCATDEACVGGKCVWEETESYAIERKMQSDSASPREFVEVLSNGQLPSLVNAAKTYAYNGSSYSTQMKESIYINADAKFDKTTPVKDFGVFITSSGFEYVLEFGDGVTNGIPAVESESDDSEFVDGDTDNIVIPFFGENYTVLKVDKSAVPYNVKLARANVNRINYTEGTELKCLNEKLFGKGYYEGHALKIKVDAVTVAGPAADTSKVRLVLYTDGGEEIDSQTVGANTFLEEIFTYNGEYVLETPVYVWEIGFNDQINKGYAAMSCGVNIVRLYDNKPYPFDGTDTNSDNDYWIAELEFQSSGNNSNPKVDTLQRIVIKNSVQKWNNSARSHPLFAGSEALLNPEHSSPDLQKARMLEGIGISENTPGYGFVTLEFEGFNQDMAYIGITIGQGDCKYPTYGLNVGCVSYTDSRNVVRSIPFYFERTGADTGTWQFFNIDSANFWYNCSTTDQTVKISPSDPYLNGGKVEWSADNTKLKTDWGFETIAGAVGKIWDIFGVAYRVTDTGSNGTVYLGADGYCQFSSTDPNTTPTYIGMGQGAPLNNKIYYSDDLGASVGKASYPLAFTGGSSNFTDTYRYGFTINETYNKIYLLLDRTTNFNLQFPSVDISFLGTNLTEDGAVIISGNQTETAGANPTRTTNNHRTHFVPSVSALGGAQANQYYIAVFGIDSNSDPGIDLNINIDTGKGKPIAFPNNQLSSWTADVTAAGNLWTLTTDTSSDTFLQKAVTDYGTFVALTSEMAVAAIPEEHNSVLLKVTK